MFASLRSNERSLVLAAIVALILRTLDSELYYQFVNDSASDIDVVDKLFAGANWANSKSWEERRTFEAVIIMARQEALSSQSFTTSNVGSTLLQRYKEQSRIQELSQELNEPNNQYAAGVVHYVSALKREMNVGRAGIGFKRAVQRIELLSTDLLDNSESGREQSV